MELDFGSPKGFCFVLTVTILYQQKKKIVSVETLGMKVQTVFIVYVWQTLASELSFILLRYASIPRSIF